MLFINTACNGPDMIYLIHSDIMYKLTQKFVHFLRQTSRVTTPLSKVCMFCALFQSKLSTALWTLNNMHLKVWWKQYLDCFDPNLLKTALPTKTKKQKQTKKQKTKKSMPLWIPLMHIYFFPKTFW